MKSIRNHFFSLLFLFSASLVHAQSAKHCLFDEIYQKNLEDRSFVEAQMALNDAIKHSRQEKNDTVIRIPLVFHIVYKNQRENISNAQIESQLKVLNNDFRKLNSDSTNANGFLSVDTKIEFCLAKETPSGELSSGVTRTVTPIDNVGRPENGNYHKIAPIWDREKYINVWVCDIDPNYAIGFAFPPTESNVNNEGIVIDVTAFGTIGTAEAPYNKGRTLTHEMGHMLNLLHLWGTTDQCGSSDFVADTPEQKREVVGCPDSSITCGSKDMLSNYMGYVDDRCMGNFTPGQKARMRAALQMFRPGWSTDDECWSTGIEEHSNLDESKLYPNPNEGSFSLDLSAKLNRKQLELVVYNVVGEEVDFQLEEEAKGYKITVDGLIDGLYFLKIKGSRSSEIIKFIVNKE